MSDQFDSNDLFVLKNLWNLTPRNDRQKLFDLLSNDSRLSEPLGQKFTRAKTVWMQTSERDRQTWREWVLSQ